MVKMPQSLKIKLGFWTLELKAKKIKSIDQIDDKVTDMSQQMALLTEQNRQLNEKLEKIQNQMLENILKLGQKIECIEPLLYRPSFQWDMMKENSKIVTTQTEQKRIRGFFGHRDFNVRLLYRASENKFLTSKFHQKCNGIRSTLVLCQTQFGNKIGGYTSNSWQSPSQEQEVFEDQGDQTFIFSLTQNDKFKLMDGKCIIRRNRNFGPYFGKCSLCIDNQAHKKFLDYFNIDSFYNKKYSGKDETSYERIIGKNTIDNSFTISEWQVWELTFPDNQSDEQVNSNQQNQEKNHAQAQEEDQQSPLEPIVRKWPPKGKKIIKTKK